MQRVYDEQPSKPGFTLKGRYIAQLYGPDGNLKQEVVGKNVVCTNGKEFLASFLYSAALAAATNTCKYIAIGSDSTAEAAANTALGTELSRHTGTVSYVSNQIYQVKATFATGSGTGSIYEYGLFSSSTGGTLISRDTEALITKGANDTLTVTYQLTIS
jgi:hypothetical protein